MTCGVAGWDAAILGAAGTVWWGKARRCLAGHGLSWSELARQAWWGHAWSRIVGRDRTCLGWE
jgi:hypothetical protein